MTVAAIARSPEVELAPTFFLNKRISVPLEMPLADIARRVPGVLARAGKRGQILEWRRVVAHDTVPHRLQARHQHGAIRTADRPRADGILKPHPLAGDLIDIRRRDLLVSIATKRMRSHLIGENENDVGTAMLLLIGRTSVKSAHAYACSGESATGAFQESSSVQ